MTPLDLTNLIIAIHACAGIDIARADTHLLITLAGAAPGRAEHHGSPALPPVAAWSFEE